MKLSWVSATIGVVMVAVAGIAASAWPAHARQTAPRIEHYAVDATIDPASARLDATIVIDVAGDDVRRPDEPIRFLLNRNLAIEAATAGDHAIEWRESEGFNPKHFWSHPDYAALGGYDHVREIEMTPGEAGWPSPPRITIRYSGAIDDTLHPPEEEYGRGFETTTGLIEERGVFLAGSTFWIPTVPDHMFTFSLTTRVPPEWDAVSQGRIEDLPPDDGHRIVRYDCPYPMEEIYLCAGPWIRRQARHGETDVLTYTYAEDDELTSTYIDATGEYLDRYEALIGPYPFSKFALVENFWETGYGMPSFTLLGSTVIRLPFIVHTSYGHEILHCWWGNGVFVDADGGNWCEGLTSFMADYAYKQEESAEAAMDYRRSQLTGYLNYVGDKKDIPLTAFRERHSGATQAIGYGKTLMIFHMLHERVGDARFYDAIRSFYRDFTFRNASWTDLLNEFETVSGEDLEWFHDQWIRQSGAPVLSLGPVRVEPAGGRYNVIGDILQVDPVYRLDVPVVATTASGATVRSIVSCDEKVATFGIALDEKPVRVAVDPDFDVFRKLHREEIPPVISQTMGADSTVIVIASSEPDSLREAYQELAESWARKPGVRIISDEEVTRDLLHDADVWLFGHTTLTDQFEGTGAEVGELRSTISGVVSPSISAFPPPGVSFVATRVHPQDPARSWSWLLFADAKHAAAIGRKVPHYGKYSYLVFDGATNIGKGTWEITRSPMVASLE